MSQIIVKRTQDLTSMELLPSGTEVKPGWDATERRGAKSPSDTVTSHKDSQKTTEYHAPGATTVTHKTNNRGYTTDRSGASTASDTITCHRKGRKNTASRVLGATTIMHRTKTGGCVTER